MELSGLISMVQTTHLIRYDDVDFYSVNGQVVLLYVHSIFILLFNRRWKIGNAPFSSQEDFPSSFIVVSIV